MFDRLERLRSVRQDFALSLAIAVAVAAVGWGIAVVAEFMGASRELAHGLDDILTGVVVGAAMFVIFRGIAHRRAAAKKRLEDISEMNHHVRNALQIIVTSHFVPDSDERVQIIAKASDRIEFALREFNV